MSSTSSGAVFLTQDLIQSLSERKGRKEESRHYEMLDRRTLGFLSGSPSCLERIELDFNSLERRQNLRRISRGYEKSPSIHRQPCKLVLRSELDPQQLAFHNPPPEPTPVALSPPQTTPHALTPDVSPKKIENHSQSIISQESVAISNQEHVPFPAFQPLGALNFKQESATNQSSEKTAFTVFQPGSFAASIPSAEFKQFTSSSFTISNSSASQSISTPMLKSSEQEQFKFTSNPVFDSQSPLKMNLSPPSQPGEKIISAINSSQTKLSPSPSPKKSTDIVKIEPLSSDSSSRVRDASHASCQELRQRGVETLQKFKNPQILMQINKQQNLKELQAILNKFTVSDDPYEAKQNLSKWENLMLKQLENIVLSPESELYLAQFFNKLITKSEQLTGKTNDVRTIKFSRLFSRLCIRLIDGMGPEHGPKALNVLFSIFHARCPMTMILPSAEYSSTLMESLSKKDIDAFDGMIRLFGSIIVEKFYCKDYAWRWVASLCNGDPQRCPHIIDCLESITIFVLPALQTQYGVQATKLLLLIQRIAQQAQKAGGNVSKAINIQTLIDENFDSSANWHYKTPLVQ